MRGMGKQLAKKSAVGEAGLQTIRAVSPLMVRICEHDEALALQLVRALNNVVLSIGRAEYLEAGGVRTHLLAAMCSANEARALLQMVVDWRYCTWRSVRRPYTELNRTAVMLAELARRKRPRLT
jgi:hypothetical protein